MGRSLKPMHIALFVAIMAVWGLNFAIAKIGLRTLPPILMMALRWGLVALMMVPFLRRPRGQWPAIILLSFTLGFVHFTLIFTGLRTLDAGTAAIAIQLQVPFAAVLAAVVFRDMLGWRRAAGMAIAFAGVAVVAGEPRLEGHYLALAMVIAAACIWSIANIQIKQLGKIDGMSLNGWIGVFATPQLLLGSWLLEDGQWEALGAMDWSVIASVLYQAVFVVGFGYGAWYRLLRVYDVNQAMPFLLLLPVFGVLSGVLMLDESLSVQFIAGGLMTVVGIAIIMLRRPRLVAPGAERI